MWQTLRYDGLAIKIETLKTNGPKLVSEAESKPIHPTRNTAVRVEVACMAIRKLFINRNEPGVSVLGGTSNASFRAHSLFVNDKGSGN